MGAREPREPREPGGSTKGGRSAERSETGAFSVGHVRHARHPTANPRQRSGGGARARHVSQGRGKPKRRLRPVESGHVRRSTRARRGAKLHVSSCAIFGGYTRSRVGPRTPPI